MEAKKFLQGTNIEIYQNIKQKIQQLAKNEHFIEADILKNQIFSLERLKNSQKETDFTKFTSLDIIVLGTNLTKIEVFSIRNGYALGGNLFEINKHEG